MTIWRLAGIHNQDHGRIIQEALVRCDFPFDRLLPGLALEDKTQIEVSWEDLSRYTEQAVEARAHGEEEHSHVTDPDTGAVAHPIERVVDGRKRVFGLFYLPPFTSVVLDNSLAQDRELAIEVFLAEAAHAVDYHYMTTEHRRQITNLLHDEDLRFDHPVGDGVAFNLDGHECSWFDVGPYRMWVGEAFMESFIEAFSNLRVTIALGHPTGPTQAAAIRRLLLGESEVEPEPTPAVPYFGLHGSKVFHDSHQGIDRDVQWATRSAAVQAGRRACGVCRP